MERWRVNSSNLCHDDFFEKTMTDNIRAFNHFYFQRWFNRFNVFTVRLQPWVIRVGISCTHTSAKGKVNLMTQMETWNHNFELICADSAFLTSAQHYWITDKALSVVTIQSNRLFQKKFHKTNKITKFLFSINPHSIRTNLDIWDKLALFTHIY